MSMKEHNHNSLVSLMAPILAVLLASCAVRCGTEATEPVKNHEPAVGGGSTGSASTRAASCVDGARALAHIEKLVSFGARHAGTPGLEKARGMIVDTLRSFGLEPVRRDFLAYTPHPDMNEVMMANIIVDIPGPGKKWILIGGHFDGKIIEEGVFLGANDGGSSTGLLLEIARCLKENPPAAPVRIAFFDGEESLLKWTDSDSLYGSKRMAADLLEKNEHKMFAAMVNVDMIGDKRLKIFRETMSTRWVFHTLEQTAKRLGHGLLFTGPRMAIEDDHVPFMKIGIPAANLIDLRFGPGWTSNDYWHTADDTVDKLSTNNMTAVGQIVLDSIPDLAKGAPSKEHVK